jgi:hypothetical protein
LPPFTARYTSGERTTQTEINKIGKAVPADGDAEFALATGTKPEDQCPTD